MGSPKSFARMGRAESEVGPTAAELQVISPFLPTLMGSSKIFDFWGERRPSADNLGAPKELCSNGERGIGSRLNCSRAAGHSDLPDERASPTLCPQPFSRRDLEIALRIWRLRPPVRPSLLRRYFFGIACPRRWFHKRLRAFYVAIKSCSISTYARSS